MDVGVDRSATWFVCSNSAQCRDFLCCAVVCRQRLCDVLITCSRSPTVDVNSVRNLTFVRRPQSHRIAVS